MATTYYQDIQKLYVAYFNRPADVAGLAYWETVVEAAKGNTTAVSAAFAAEAEYKTVFSGMSNAEIVNKVYLNLFGRDAEAAGKAYWADLLDKKSISIDKVVTQVAAGAQGSDLTAYNNKVVAAQALTTAMDTTAEQAGYNALSIATAKAFISSITTDASLAAAIAPAALNDTVAKIVAAGTPFTVVGALQSLEVATDAKFAFLDAFDGKVDGKALKVDTDVTAAVTAKDVAVAGKMSGANAAAYTATTSTAVKAAIISDEVALNAANLKAAQAALVDTNAAVAKVDGLATAISALAAATASVKAQNAANVSANADLQGKFAAFKVTTAAADATAAVAANGTVTTAGVDGVAGNADDVKLIVVGTDGKLALATGVTETGHTGITALLNASIAKEASDVTLAAATSAKIAAQFQVDHLDVDPANATIETGLLTTVKAQMADFATYLTGTTMPTEAQIAAQQMIYDSKAAAATKIVTDAGAAATAAQIAARDLAVTTKTDFAIAVGNYHTSAAASNPLASAQVAQTTAIDASATAATDLAKATAALDLAKADVAKMVALNANVTAATEVFGDHDFNLVPLSAAFAVGTADSDVFVLGDVNTTISLFGLQGADQLFIGSGYKLNTGALTTGDDAALEAFVKQVGTDVTLTIETSKFGSHSATPEVMVVTLIGVDAAKVHLDSNGIVTVG